MDQFSIFLSAIFSSDDCLSTARIADVLENVYLGFLFSEIILSTIGCGEWTEKGFRICSTIMGVFELLMVGLSHIYAFQATIASISVIILLLYALTYILPLIMNIRQLKFCDLLKGIWYSVFLVPTYINLFTIYAISNIHDVTWVSRPSTQNPKYDWIKCLMEIKYKNYRSNFLVAWVMLNAFVGYLIAYMSRNGQYYFILWIGWFLMIVLLIKLIFACCYWLKSKNDRRRANIALRRKSRYVFIISNSWAEFDLEAREGNMIFNNILENEFETYRKLHESVVAVIDRSFKEANINYRTSVVLVSAYNLLEWRWDMYGTQSPSWAWQEKQGIRKKLNTN